MRYVENVLAFAVLMVGAGTLWFSVFWKWFEHWRRHRVLTYACWAVLFSVWAALIVAFDARSWFGHLRLPPYVHGLGWVLLAVVSVFGFIADRQIGVRVRSFAPFFDARGHIELKTTGAYGVVRHPIYAAGIGFGVSVFLITGSVSVLLAWLIFTLGATRFSKHEEEHLLSLLDDPGEYDRYRRRVPALLPRPRRSEP